jgi:hypothetical protein
VKRPSAQQLALWIPLGVLAVALILLKFGPVLWVQQVSGLYVLPYLGTMVTIYASHEILGKFRYEWLVYIIGTYEPPVAVGLFAPGPYNIIGYVVFFSIVGVIIYYTFLAVLVKDAKRVSRERKTRPPVV